MARIRKESPDFFDDDPFDPVIAATGSDHQGDEDDPKNSSTEERKKWKIENRKQQTKKKAGFYLSIDVLERFTRKFHELKLSGVMIENKSALVETALSFALDDIDMGENSEVLKKFRF
ncbi:MAG: hypothetical protein GY857_14490 [Desulfobacula sp.]|nr:hypothetical protein [Desulfobacula sp.]